MNVLVLEDNLITRKILAAILTKRGYTVTSCANAEAAIDAYRLLFYPLLFLDLFLPGMDGFSFCQWVRAQPEGKRHLILVGTSSDSQTDLQKILEAGADDYIIKPYRAATLDIRLIIAQQRIKNIEIRIILEADLLQERERLQYQSTHDSLTQLLNRTALMQHIQSAVQAAAPGNTSALLYVDLDNFKLVNDSAGGTPPVTKFYATSPHSSRARFAPTISHLESAATNSPFSSQECNWKKRRRSPDKSFRNSSSSPSRTRADAFYIGTSIGIAIIDGALDAEASLACADSACYAAKIHGKNRAEVYHDNDESMAELRTEGPRLAEIKTAISHQGFDIVLQPIVELNTLTPSFFEVLIRMNRNGKLLPPRAFLPIAERFHLLAEIDRQIIGKTVPILLTILIYLWQ